MRKRFVIAMVLGGAAWSTGMMSQVRMGPQIPVPAHITMPEEGVIVPMDDMGGRPLIEVTINGKGPYRFILDTGAVATVVSEDLSRELSLSAPEGMRVASVSGGPPPAIVMVHDIRIGQAGLEGLIAAVRPLSG